MKVGDGLDSQSFLGTLLGEKKFTERSTLLVQANDGEYFNQQSKKAQRKPMKLIATGNCKPSSCMTATINGNQKPDREDEQSQRVKRMSADLNSIFRSRRSTDPYRLNGNDDLKKEPKVHANELKAPRANLLCKVLGVQEGSKLEPKVEDKRNQPRSLDPDPRDSQKWDSPVSSL